MTTQETPTAEVVESYRVTIRCKFHGPTNHRGSRISVQRWDSPAWGKDPNRITIGWDYSLSTGENYAEAVRQYTTRAEWVGPWITSTVPDGAVAVWGGTIPAIESLDKVREVLDAPEWGPETLDYVADIVNGGK